MTGIGWDLHRLERGGKLIIGGVSVVSDYGTVAHSDGDVLLHALTDALLGAAALGDIGEHFPDSDPAFKGMDSSFFVKGAMQMIALKNLVPVNVDCVVVLQEPKLKDYKESIRKNLQQLTGLPAERVNVKAKTSEKVGPCGNLEAIEAWCVVELKEKAGYVS